MRGLWVSASVLATAVHAADPSIPTFCGHYPAPLSTTQPNVLLVGDSISMPTPPSPGGYGDNTKRLLNNASVNVWHNGGWDSGGQASNTVKGLNCTDKDVPGNWLNISAEGPIYDIVHFNFGLHDLVDPGPGEGQEHVDIPEYGENLKEIYNRLSSIGKQLIWTTTTPCPNVTTSMGRTNAKVIAYNAQANASLTEAASAANQTLVVDDLYGAVVGFCGENYKSCSLQRPANVHFEPEGDVFLAEHVSGIILQTLKGLGHRV